MTSNKVLFFVSGIAPNAEETEAILKLLSSGFEVLGVSVEKMTLQDNFDFSQFQSLHGAVPEHIKLQFDSVNGKPADVVEIVEPQVIEKRKFK